MKEKLELKILTLVVTMLVLGIIVAGFMVLTIEKRSLYRLTGSSSETTARVIASDIERVMLEGRADLAKSLLEDLKGASGAEDISVLNYRGASAFEKGAPEIEGALMKEMAQTKAPTFVKGLKKLTYYKPLQNSEKCRTCHANDPEILGAVKISISIAKEYAAAYRTIVIVILATFLACLIFSLVLWMMIRRMVIVPVKSLEDAAAKLSEGDMSFKVDVKSTDEIGRLSTAIRESLVSISSILQRIKDVSKRVTHVAGDVENESRKVVDGTMVETEAINNISASIEELNAVISEIAEGTDGLAASAEETSASMVQMVTNITEITSSTQDMSSAVEATSASIEQLSATIKEVASNTNELAGAAEETQSAILEIANSVKEVEQRAKESAMLSDKVKNEAVTFGMVSVEKTIQGMKNIKATVEKTADYVKKLGGRSQEIGQILNVIDEITDQTTMLALNAAILAAQAGDHGKGFSVVADEIKELAERTSMSTQEIATLIQSVQQEVGDAVTAMEEGLKSVETGFKVSNEAVDALRKIVESSRRSYEMAAAIEHSTTEQTKAALLVSKAMEKVLSMVGEIAKATTEQNKGIQLIMNATDKIRDVSSYVKNATNEQSSTSKQISMAVEHVSDKSQQISRAINEQKIGSNQIWNSVEKIKDLPRQNRDRSFHLDQMVKELMRDAELAAIEMERFTFAEGTSAGLLKMGIVPLQAPAVMYKKFSPLAEYLGKKLKRKIELKVAVDFQGAVNDIGQGITQFCFMTPSTYVEAHEKYAVQVLVKALREGKPFQHSVIVARNDSAINKVEDIRGRSFAFGDPHSTSSHIVPRAMLISAGVDVSDLSYHNYLGHHDDVAKAVLAGDFDAGGIMETTAYAFKDKGLKLVKISEDIPEFNICVSRDLDSLVSDELKNALVGINGGDPAGSAILKSIDKSYTGFLGASDEDYQGVRTMMKKIGLV